MEAMQARPAAGGAAAGAAGAAGVAGADRAKVDAVREALPAARAVRYFNTGTCGPIPRAVHEVETARAAAEFEAGRIGPGAWERHAEAQEAARARVAALLGASPDEVALTHHTTEGMNIVAHGIRWRPGDEVVTTAHEHPGGLLPLAVLHHRWGVQVRAVDLGDGADAADRLLAACGPRTRLLAVSHVLWTTGARLPLADIARAARARGIRVLVDGAQSVGAIPVDVRELGVDAYTVSGQKWLCGPEGTGALYVRRDFLPEVEPTFAGYHTAAAYDFTGHFLPSAGARRYETGTTHRPSLAGWAAGLAWLAGEVGWAWIFDRIRQLAGRARGGLGRLVGVEVLTPPSHAGLVSFRVAGLEPQAVVAALAKAGYVVRDVPDARCVRLSAGFFNTEDEVDGLVAEVAALARPGPG